MPVLKLSICLRTYNHEKYLAQCLDSILVQETSFIYEIVIGEDASTDNTGKIAETYLSKYPDKIRVLKREKNLGYTKNFNETLLECKGEYIAIFDGDDLMCPGKLQKQVDFLDSNPDYVMVAHDLNEFRDSDYKTIRVIKPCIIKEYYSIKDLLRYGSIFGNTSKMFRRSALPPNVIDTRISFIEDVYLTLHIVKEGIIGYIPETLGEYRRHPKAVMYNLNGKKVFEDIIIILDSLDQLYGNKYKNLYFHELAYAYMMYGIHEIESGNTFSARRKLVQSIMKKPFLAPSQYIYLALSFLPRYYRNMIINYRRKRGKYLIK